MAKSIPGMPVASGVHADARLKEVTCPISEEKGFIFFVCKGLARTQSPTTKNYALELPTFGVIARVSPTEVQWKGLALGAPPN